MSDYKEIVKALRYCRVYPFRPCNDCPLSGMDSGCIDKLHGDAADAIERLRYTLEKYHERVVYLEEMCKEV